MSALLEVIALTPWDARGAEEGGADRIEVVGTTPRSRSEVGAGDRPAYATGRINLDVSTATRALTVKAVPRDAVVKPGAATKIDVKVTDRGDWATRNSDPNRGRGVPLMRALADTAAVTSDQNGTTVHMIWDAIGTS